MCVVFGGRDESQGLLPWEGRRGPCMTNQRSCVTQYQQRLCEGVSCQSSKQEAVACIEGAGANCHISTICGQHIFLMRLGQHAHAVTYKAQDGSEAKRCAPESRDLIGMGLGRCKELPCCGIGQCGVLPCTPWRCANPNGRML